MSIILWFSKLQTKRSEYNALIQSMQKVIPFMASMKEVSYIFDIHIPKPELFCKVLVENESCITVAEPNKFSPRTKHIAVKYHHLRIFVKNKIIQICNIDTQEKTG